MLNKQPIIQSKLSQEELAKHFPRYAFNPTPLPYGGLKRVWIGTVINLMKLITWIILNPRKTPVGILDKKEVNEVYEHEWKHYDLYHHITTRGQDLLLRKWAGDEIAFMRRNKFGKIKILDLCTGTGLAIKEIISVLKEWGIKAEIIGLDFNEKMLSVARSSVISGVEGISVNFVQGDATDLKFKANSYDFITQIWGIGGIDEQIKEFYGVLKTLKPGGHFIMADTHCPIPEFPGEWPFFFKWLKMPIFEAAVFEKATIPLVLKRKWGWRGDPTPVFYLLPFVVLEDNGFWGFEPHSFEVNPAGRWWFGLPFMGTAQIIVKKKGISKETYDARKAVLELCKIPN